MEKEKIAHKKAEVCEILEEMQGKELKEPRMVEYYKDLAKLHYYLGKMEEDAEKKEYSQRMGQSMAMSGRDGIEWGAYAPYGQQRGADGRYMSQDMGSNAYGGMSYGMQPKEQIRELMQNPNISYETKECLRKAMETVR